MKIVSSSIAALLSLVAALALTSVDAIDVGDAIPSDMTLHHGFPPQEISLDARLKGKNVLMVGLPGAFTPT